MTGSIQTKNDCKNYYAVISGHDENGKRKQQWINTNIPVKGNNKRKAEIRLREILAEYRTDSIHTAKNIFFTDFIVQWLDTAKAIISPTTYDAYCLTLNSHILPYFNTIKVKVRDVTPAIIQWYVNIKLEKLSPNTVRKHLANLSKCLDSAVKQGLISVNPVKRIEMPKKIKFNDAKHYNEKQIEQLLEISKGDPPRNCYTSYIILWSAKK